MDVADWLRGLGLERYEQAFRDNDVDAEVLPELTADDLVGLGVASIGHRRKLLAAIAALRAGPAPSAATVPPVEPTSGALAAARSSEAERRQLTVMFVDLAGSTALSTRLDPEDMREILRAYRDAVSGAVARFEGHVAKYMGDGVLAYFGWPVAHEDAAERAVRAGLAIAGAVAGLEAPGDAPLAARVGIATGPVVVGDLVGSGEARERTVVGETPNLAARLQELAGPGGVVIAEGTRRLLGGLFAYRDLGPASLKGFAEPVPAWRVAGEGGAEGRFEALHGGRLTPLVGREHELGILLERWAWARDGDGQVVLLAGEPGIGKSRLVRAFRERLGDEPSTTLGHYCSPHHVNSALHPVVGLLERTARLGRDDPPEARLAKLEAVLAQSGDGPDEAAPLFAALLGIPTGTRYPAPALTPEAQKRRTLRALVDQLAGLAAQRPVLALYEDAHWIDPTTLELLDLVVERVQRLRVLVLVTFRPEFRPPWTGHAHVTTLSMSRLARRQGADLVTRVAGDRELPAAIVEEIVARTDGVPLFVEELTKAVLESGLLADTGGRYELAGPVPALAIPMTLHDSLMARLDRLAPVKEVAQIGAVIGREFSHELLAAVAPMSGDQLNDALEQLVGAELVFRRGAAPGATYSFKHALVQDAAYQSLLRSRRQQLHARIAELLERGVPDASDTGPEVLARHLTEAGMAERAIPYWHRAGELAAGRSANVEAIAHLGAGLDLIATLPVTPERLEEELALRLAIGGPLTATKGYAAPEVERAYGRALALCERLGRSAELFTALRGLWNYHLVRGELERAQELAERLTALADERAAPLRRAYACRALGGTLFFRGRLAEAVPVLDEGVAIDELVLVLDDRRADLLLHPESSGVVCRLLSGRALWLLGFPDAALERVGAALDLARGLGHANSLAFALNVASALRCWRREFDAALGHAEEAIGFATEHRQSQWLAFGTICRGFALAGLGRPAEGTDRLRAGLADMHRVGAHLLDTQWLGFLAEAQLRAGEPIGALATLERAVDAAGATGERYYEAELYRLRGIVLTEAGEGAEAEVWLRRSIDTARDQRASSLELRSAVSLARLLLADRGGRAEARDLLAPVYGWFTEGFGTPDLREARELLDELR